MKYIVCEKPGLFQMQEKKAPSLKDGEALLKIQQVGICGTDLHAFAGNQPFFSYPRILGHELAGQILEIGANPQGLQVGDKVAIMPYVSCQICIACRKGKPNCCSNLKVLGVHVDGGMQEYINVPVELLLPANDLNWDEIAIIEPLAIGAHAIRRAQIERGETVLVIGCGPIGIGILSFAQQQGARVIAMDINEQRLDYVSKNLGIVHTILAKENALIELQKLTNQDLADVVIDATGNKRALESGYKYMAHGGRYVLVGLSKESLCFPHPEIHARETTLLCSRNATLEDFEYVMNTLRQKAFPTEAFITHRSNFQSMIGEFKNWLDPSFGVIKAMVNLD